MPPLKAKLLKHKFAASTFTDLRMSSVAIVYL